MNLPNDMSAPVIAIGGAVLLALTLMLFLADLNTSAFVLRWLALTYLVGFFAVWAVAVVRWLQQKA